VSVLVVGLNHKTAPVEVLETVAVPEADLAKALFELAGFDQLSEVVLVSTCQRTEVYSVARRYHPAVGQVRSFLAEWGQASPETLSSHLYEYHDEAAARHLFKVAAGLDSAVLGEGEVLGQLADSWEAARREGTSGPIMATLFRHAIEVGKRVRTETAIARGTTSLSQAAVALARSELGSLEGRTTLVIGAGEMGESMAQALAGSAKSGRVLVANRTRSRADELASRFGGKALDWRHMPDGLAQADVVLASTGAPTTVLDARTVAGAMAKRPERPMLVVDIAVPRDVAPEVADLEGVTLFDMDDLAEFAQKGLDGRAREVPAAELIVDAEVARYCERLAHRQVAPVIASLFERAEELRLSEWERLSAKLSTLDDEQRRSVEALTKGIVAKILHEPTVALKAGVGTPMGEQLAESMRTLFGL
jgi:glutamyl-tRNA reductase